MTPDVLDRFWSKVMPAGDCLVWTGALTTDGYGHLHVNGKRLRAHRIMYEMKVGPIPLGLQLDHTCRNRCCVSPTHLRIVTCKMNVLCGRGFAAVNASKFRCKHGHDLSLSRRRVDRGTRECRQCQTIHQRGTRIMQALGLSGRAA